MHMEQSSNTTKVIYISLSMSTSIAMSILREYVRGSLLQNTSMVAL